MQGAISIGNIAEFVIYINMLTFPVAALGWVVSLVQRAAASQQRINEFLLSKPDIVSGKRGPAEIKGHIEFKDVSFTYANSSKPSVCDISFDIPPGGSVAITGRTGSGKSTIANLLMRFSDPEKGEILIDGVPLKDLNLESYRSQTGFVPQELFLFSDTIANNIAFGIRGEGKEKEQTEQIRNAAEDACILDNILEFPKGFETKVGERGITLSGGQKQRISIARAIIRKPAVLIFDDCLSAVDTVTEEKILENLRRIMKGKTTVIISHRVSSVKNADIILVLDKGKIIEKGTHEQLISSRGAYFDLVERQTIEAQLMNG